MAEYTGNENVTLHPNCSWLPFDKNSWVTKLNDGTLMTLNSIRSEDKDGNEIWTPCITTSSDGGYTWTEPAEVPLAPTTSPHWLAETAIIMQAKSGVIVMLYEDMANMVFEWNSETKRASDNTRLNVWACRSTDGGKTWDGFVQLVDGWCGALIDIKQLSNGRIVATVMDMIYSQGRHISFTCVSDDDGLTWQRGNHLDMGGRGHHDGAMEPTFVELKSGKLQMLIRTNLDVFWNAYSDDGKYWRTMERGNIDASSSPGHLLRLSSGRIALVWNRLCPEGQTEPERSEAGNDFAENATSWHRNELSIAFSSDECKTWTTPVVVARNTAGQISYPYMLEYKPGDLWVITRAPVGGAINFRLDESKF